MLHILWIIIKFLLTAVGVILGIILGLVLLMVLLLLFCPVCYQASGAKKGKVLTAKAQVSWLFRGIAVGAEYGSSRDLSLDIKILGISLKKVKNWLTNRKKKKKQPVVSEKKEASAPSEASRTSSEASTAPFEASVSPSEVPTARSEAEEIKAEEPEQKESADVSIADAEKEKDTTSSMQALIEDLEDADSKTKEKILPEQRAVCEEPSVPEEELTTVLEEKPKIETEEGRIEETCQTEVEDFPEKTEENKAEAEDSPEVIEESRAEAGDSSEKAEENKADQTESGKNLLQILYELLAKLYGFFAGILLKIYTKIKNIFGKIGLSIKKAQNTLTSVQNKAGSLHKTITKWKSFLLDERTLGALSLIKNEIFGIIRHVMPRRIYGEVTFGLDEPSWMGAILAILGATLPLHQNRIQIHPVYDRNMLEGETTFQGRIYGCVFVAAAIKIWFNKNFQYAFKYLLKRK